MSQTQPNYLKRKVNANKLMNISTSSSSIDIVRVHKFSNPRITNAHTQYLHSEKN